ncbi:MAG TPA: MBL fold metallo-hydrolase [Dehalococcoidia bacterium]
MQEIARNVYVETGLRGCNAGFVVTSEGVVLIDTPMMPDEALRWRDEIGKHGPIRYVINTEPHIDHFAGGHFFEAPVVAHEGARGVIAAASVEQLTGMMAMMGAEGAAVPEGFGFRLPEVTFASRLTLHLGGLTFQLTHFPGHTPFQLAVYIPERGALFTSDNVTGRLPIFREANPQDWLASLERMAQIGAEVLVPGHGEVGGAGYLEEMRGHIQAWVEAVASAKRRGASLTEAQDSISLLDRHPGVSGRMMEQMQRQNIARLYEVFQ